MSEKTEHPTDKKLEKSREKGSVAQSQELHKLFYLIGFKIMLAGGWYVWDYLKAFFVRSFDFYKNVDDTINFLTQSAFVFCIAIACCLTLLTLIFRCMAGWLQFRPLFSVAALQPKLSALNPIHNIKNIFTLAKLYTLISCCILFVAFFIALSLSLLKTFNNIYQVLNYSVESVFFAFLHSVGEIFNMLISILIFFCAVDFLIQRHQFMKQQKMTKQEVKDEYKESEGNQEMKAYLRAIAQSASHNNAAPKHHPDNEAKKADFLLVNPTHFAVALSYDTQQRSLPIIVQKAEGEEARALKSSFHQEKIPVIRFRWLARKLYREVQIGDPIPRDTLAIVAQVYIFLREIDTGELDGEEILYTES